MNKPQLNCQGICCLPIDPENGEKECLPQRPIWQPPSGCGSFPFNSTVRRRQWAAWGRHASMLTESLSRSEQKSSRAWTATVGPGGCWYHLRKQNGTRHMHTLSPPAAPHETALCSPECQLSHKSTHWVSPSNLSNPAGKQHIRP